jgi:hypothetical protein
MLTAAFTHAADDSLTTPAMSLALYGLLDRIVGSRDARVKVDGLRG